VSPIKRFTILKRVHRQEQFESPDDHAEFQAKLAQLLAKGIVEAVAVNKKHRSNLDEEAWFRDRRTGAVYRYIPPEWPSVGHWGPVENPEVPSFFESLCDHIYPSREQYDQLVVALDEAWQRGEVEIGEPKDPGEFPHVFVHHARTDETYRLVLVNPYQKGGSWMKAYLSRQEGTWPGQLVIGSPPWRRPTQAPR
jgi:hypothetical protein